MTSPHPFARRARHLRSRAFALSLSVVAAGSALLGITAGCSSSDKPAGGSSPGVGGSSGGGPGQGGPGGGLGTGGPFAFPQSKVSGSCMLTTVTNAAAATQSVYESWKGTYVVNGNPGLRVQRPESGGDTVSEGIAYGMLASVYMGDRTTFDGLWTYAQAHLDAVGLMNWHLSSSGSIVGQGSATDADEDMAWSLLMASDQWSSTAYLTAAQTLINAMYSSELFSDGSLKSGDSWADTDHMNPDYFSPAYYRVFAKATNNTEWANDVIDVNYDHLAKLTGMYGLVPDASNLEDQISGSSSSCMMCMPNYSYDACRMPWRIAMDYCFNNEPRAQTYLMKVGSFFNGLGAGNIGDGYSSAGQQTSGNHNLAFSGPAGVAAMAGYPMLLDDAFKLMVTPPNGNNAYYPQTLRVLSMLMMSGNFLDYTQLH